MVSAKRFPLSCPEKLFYACHNPKSASSKLHQNVICLSCLSLFTFKGDISRFFIFHCKFLLYVGFCVYIKNPDHFSYGSVIK